MLLTLYCSLSQIIACIILFSYLIHTNYAAIVIIFLIIDLALIYLLLFSTIFQYFFIQTCHLKFVFSKKATKIEGIFTVDLTLST